MSLYAEWFLRLRPALNTFEDWGRGLLSNPDRLSFPEYTVMEKTFKVTRRWQGNRLIMLVAFAIYISERMSFYGLI